MGKDALPNRKREFGVSTFLTRLRRDQRGNALAMIAASIVPVAGAIGGGVDLTRAYMTKARLAQACDAAVLAGRKTMDVTEITDPETGEVTKDINEVGRNAINKYLAYNFPDGMFGSQPISKVIDVDDPSELRLALSTQIDSTMLNIVGIHDIPISTECTARRDGYNVDVVMVLDVTGSMAWSLSGSNDGSYARMKALKTAAKNFMDILDELDEKSKPLGLRVRVGIVPYSQTVNVGRELYSEDASYINASAAKYYSKIGQLIKSGSPTYWNNGSAVGEVTLDMSDFVSKGIAEGVGASSTYLNPYAWRGCIEMRPTVQSINSSTPLSLDDNDWDSAWDTHDVAPGVDGAPKYQPYIRLPGNGNYGPPTLIQSNAPVWKLDVDTFTPKFKDGHVPYRVQNNLTSGGPPPSYYSAASISDYQANPENSNGPNGVCPNRVVLLSDTVTDRKAYIDTLDPTGGTYHNIGMYWGMALISPQKPFANPDKWRDPAKSSEPPADVKRYIVFMTDGDLDPDPQYSAFGLENSPTSLRNDVSNSTSDSTIVAAHRRRFEAMCRWATTQGITVSTVAFASSISSTNKASLKTCASETSNYYEASTAAKLNEAFEKIAHDIANLRITD